VEDPKIIAERILANVERVIIGKAEPVRLILVALMCQGHALIEDVPGVGKTTLARLIAAATDLRFVPYSAVLSGIKEIRGVMAEAEQQRARSGRRTLLFVDEIHRFNKAQQDAFLPYVERGDILLIGATTENPSFEVNAALLSRSQVYVLRALTAPDISTILNRALTDTTRGLGRHAVEVEPDAIAAMARHANGDARAALNLLELGVAAAVARAAEAGAPGPARLDLALAADAMQRRALVYDKDGEEHYNLISALHKSMRNSDPDAAVYWLARMVEAGEDPLYIARRLVRFAVEDIGLADPEALVHSLASWQAYERLGSPEGELAIAQSVIYLATAPKSNAVYRALGAASRSAVETGSLMPPKHILNAPTRLMKDEGYGRDYAYDHNEDEGFSGQNYFPDGLERQQFYAPTGRGFEREIKKRLDYWAKLRDERQGSGEGEASS